MGPILSRAETSKVVERAGGGYLNAACCAVNGFRVTMEDAHCMIMPKPGNVGRSIFGVFDGHSNDTCSAYVAEFLPPTLLKLPKDASKEVIEQAFIDTDAKYMSDDRGGGTTAAVCMIDAADANGNGLVATVCNTGDSRTMIIRNNTIFFVTQDHKPADPAERERIERANGMVRMNRVDGELAVSRAFGDSMFKRSVDDPRLTKVICVPDITVIPLEKGDIIIIACDGVFEGNFTNEQVCEFASRQLSGTIRPEAFSASQIPLDLGVVGACVCDQAVRRGSKDNISCMVIRVGQEGVAAVEKFGELSFVPGPPPLRNNNNSRNAFDKMSRMAKMSVALGLKRRYELLKARQQLTPPTYTELEAHAFDLQDPLDLENEERYFSGGPPQGEKDVLQWFDELTSS